MEQKGGYTLTRRAEGLARGDKTGAGEGRTTNDVGLFWPTNRDPVIVSAYLANSRASVEERNATIAAVGEAVANDLHS